MSIEVTVFVMNLPLSQHAHWAILPKDGNISQFWRAILLSPLGTPTQKEHSYKASIWITLSWCGDGDVCRLACKQMLASHQIALVLFLAQPVQKVVFLCRLPARLVWSTGVPRPDGSAAGSESERHEQPTRNSGAKCDGLLPNNVFLSGAHQQGYKIARANQQAVGTPPCWVGARHSLCSWLTLSQGYSWWIGHGKCLLL